MRSWYRRQRIKDLKRYWSFKMSNVRSEDSMKGVADQILKEHEKMVTRLKNIDQKAVENHKQARILPPLQVVG